LTSPFLAAAIVAATLAGWGVLAPAAPAADWAATKKSSAGDYGGLPEGPGRAAVYFNCSACHALKQFVQQRLSRDAWDGLLDRMVNKNKMHSMEPWARRRVLNYLATHFGVDEEDWQGLPAGLGREEVFYACQACHSLAIVKQQGLDWDSWDESLTWMVEEQEMDRLGPEDRTLILDYLTTYFGRVSSKRR
jgi:cytochrome c